MVEQNAPFYKQGMGSDHTSSLSAADPHGLISSFVRYPPDNQTTPNDIFVIWMLSHRHQTTAEAALTILDFYGTTMLQSGSDWLTALRDLFMDITTNPALLASSTATTS